jgi:HK97 family phage portal protein
MERVAPERVGVFTNANGTQIESYTVDGITIAPEQLVVFGNMQEGLLNRAGRTVRAAHALERAAYDFALNPAPQMVVKTNGTNLPKERLQALKETFLNRTSKSVTVLNADVSLETVGFDPKQLQMNEARQYLALELCRAIGMPAWFASADPSSTTYSNAVNQRRDLIDFSIRPILTIIEQRLSLTDFTPASEYVRYDLDDFLRGNPYERAQVYEILNRIGAMTIDEIREAEDIIG